MQMLGFSINMLTLFALVLAIGIVVDNAIVVVEAVHVKMHNEKLPPAKATEAAIREIGGAIIAITLVMSAVFVPVGFMSGTGGIFYRQFSLTWNLTKSINLSLQTMTNAHIEEPVGVVNKQLFPDEYEAWKDTVLTSIKNLIKCICRLMREGCFNRRYANSRLCFIHHSGARFTFPV